MGNGSRHEGGSLLRKHAIALSVIVALMALTALMLSIVSAGPASVPAQQIEFTKAASNPTPHLGEVFTFTLRFCNVSTETLEVRVTDLNPAPSYLVIITPTTGYSPTIDGIVWEGTLGYSPTTWVTVTYQMQVLGMPTTTLAAGFAVTNVATIVDRATAESLLGGIAEAPIRIMPVRVFLPLVGRDYCPASSTVASPFALQIAALHQIEGQGLARTVRPMTEAEWLAAYEETFPTLLEALEESGAGWARVRVNWSWIQPDPPPSDYVWGPYHDEKLRLVAETGVRLIATVTDSPDWAAYSPCSHIYCGPDCGDDVDRLPDYAQFLTDLVNRYEQPPYNIKHWELVNEPDYTWPNGWVGGLGCWGDASTQDDGYQYKQMLAAAYGAIKAADPEATVLMGGVAHDWFTEDSGPFDRYFPDDVMEHGGGDYTDVLNFHYFPDYRAEWERWVPHGDPPTCGIVDDGKGLSYEAWGIDLIAKTNHFRNRMSTCFGVDKPVWVTELAEHGYDNPTSLANQARYVIKGYARGLAAGVENITWYALATPNDSYGQGLLFNDWTPKPAFYAYRTLTSELTGYEYTRTLDVAGVEGYVFQNPCGREKTVGWGSGTLVFAPAGQLRVVDRAGSVNIIVDGGAGDVDGVPNGAVELQLSAEPVFASVQ